MYDYHICQCVVSTLLGHGLRVAGDPMQRWDQLDRHSGCFATVRRYIGREAAERFTPKLPAVFGGL